MDFLRKKLGRLGGKLLPSSLSTLEITERKYYVVERLSRPKPKGSKSAKRKQSKMALREFIQQMEVLVPKVGGILIKVNPAYSSVSARIIAEDLGLDIHTASAYIIALRGLKRYRKLQNDTDSRN